MRGYSPFCKEKHGGRLLCGDRSVQLLPPTLHLGRTGSRKACLFSGQMLSVSQAVSPHCSRPRKMSYSSGFLSLLVLLGGCAQRKRKSGIRIFISLAHFPSSRLGLLAEVKVSTLSLSGFLRVRGSFGSGNSASPQSSGLSGKVSGTDITPEQRFQGFSYTSARTRSLNTPWPTHRMSLLLP